MSDTILLNDSYNIHDKLVGRDAGLQKTINYRMAAGPKETCITIIDHATGKVLQTVHNKVLVAGSQFTACDQFGLDNVVDLPTYNSELNLENSKPAYQTYKNKPIVCLWCVGQSGFVSSPNEVLVVSNTDRIEPVNDILPFRYVDPDNDLDVDQRRIYFGRRLENNGKIGYYFKKFDTLPQLHIRYLDGTEVTPYMYSIDSSQQVEIYVETRLAITRLDFRDYFDQILGWGKAKVSTISLVSAWYDDSICENPEADPQDQIFYQWYQDIIPFSKFNFKEEELQDLDRAIDFNYQIFY